MAKEQVAYQCPETCGAVGAPLCGRELGGVPSAWKYYKIVVTRRADPRMFTRMLHNVSKPCSRNDSEKNETLMNHSRYAWMFQSTSEEPFRARECKSLKWGLACVTNLLCSKKRSTDWRLRIGRPHTTTEGRLEDAPLQKMAETQAPMA